MPNIQIISRENHSNKRWRRAATYQFTAKDTVCQLIVQELPKIVMSLPIAFMPTGEEFGIVALQGLEQNQNLLLDSSGRWRGGYVPALYRSFPFLLANSQKNEQVLCINAESGLLTEEMDGEPFFSEDGTPSPAISDILNFLKQINAGRQSSTRICNLLQKHKLIQPWPITLQKDDGERNLAGLYRIDEDAFNKLPAEALTELRDGGALPTVFCQLISMQHLTVLTSLLDSQNQSTTTSLPKELDLEFLNDSGNISFSDL